MYQNLHCHTKTSDGELTYQQVLDICSQNKISVVAFTDHDALPNKKAIKLLEKNRNHPTKWVIGCEISSGWPKEIGGPASNFHLVGLFVDPLNKDLIEHCQKTQKGRIERMEKIVKNLQSLGFEIAKDDCLKETKEGTVGRPHIVAALKKKPKNLKIIEELRKKMAQEAKHNSEVKQKYETMIARGEDQYPYFLFLDPQAFLPDIYVDYLYWKDMDENVKIIRKAGGVAILAHWSFSKQTVNEKMIEKFFQQKRLDGAEIVFGADKASNLNLELRKDMEIMEKLTQKYKVLASGGGDSHTKKDIEFFSQEKWLAEKTVNLVQKMIKTKKLNLQFSSL